MQPAQGASQPELVVRSDNSILRPKFRTAVVLNAVLVGFALVMAGVVATLDIDGIRLYVWVFLLLAVGPILQVAFQCYHWGGRLAVSRPLTLDAWGAQFEGNYGTVRVPWEVVTKVQRTNRLGTRMLVFQLDPRAVPGYGGVEADPAYWPRYLKKGLWLGEMALTPGFDAVLSAVHHYSQGRTQVV